MTAPHKAFHTQDSHQKNTDHMYKHQTSTAIQRTEQEGTALIRGKKSWEHPKRQRPKPSICRYLKACAKVEREAPLALCIHFQGLPPSSFCRSCCLQSQSKANAQADQSFRGYKKRCTEKMPL